MGKISNAKHPLAMKKGTSCRACKARKVRCDAGIPCAACVRSARHLGKECDCSNVRKLEVRRVLEEATKQQAAPLPPAPTLIPKGSSRRPQYASHHSLSPELPSLDWTPHSAFSSPTASPTPSSPSSPALQLPPSQLPFDLDLTAAFSSFYDPSYAFPQSSYAIESLYPPPSPAYPSTSYALPPASFPPASYPPLLHDTYPPPISIFTPNPYENPFFLPQTVDPSQVFFDPMERKEEGGRMGAWLGDERRRLWGA